MAKPKRTKLQVLADKHESKGYDAIALEVMNWFTHMRNHRNNLGIDALLAECDQRYNSKYTDEELMEMEDHELALQIGLTGMLTRTALMWIEGAFANAMDRPWAIEPTPNPSLPPDLQKRVDQAIAQHVTDMVLARQRGKMMNPEAERSYLREMRNTADRKAFELAKEASVAMERKIEDYMVESRWRDIFYKFCFDFVKYPFAVVKGPLYGPVVRNAWDGSEYVEQVEDGYYFENVNPHDIFWSADSKCLKSGKAVIHRIPYSASEILALRDTDGVVKDHIKLVLGLSDPEASQESDTFEAETNGTDADTDRKLFTVYNFYGLLTGAELLAFAKDEEQADISADDLEDPDKEFDTERFGKISVFKTYEVFAMVCRGYTLLVRIEESRSQMRPFHHASSYPRAEGIVGSCVPLVVSDVADVLNMTFRGSAYNMLMSSGPMLFPSTERFAGKELPEVFKPWSVHPISRSNISSNNSGPAVEQLVLTNVLPQNYQFFNDLWERAHRIAGIPPYMYGDNQGSPRTLGAFTLQYGAATKTIKSMIAAIDHGVIEPMIEQFYHLLMKYDDDMSIKADARVRVRGSQGLIAAEQRQARPLELAQALAPLLAQLGPEKAVPIVERFVGEALSESGYDPAEMGQPNQSLAGQEAQNRALDAPVELDGRSQAAINVMGGAQVPSPVNVRP